MLFVAHSTISHTTCCDDERYLGGRPSVLLPFAAQGLGYWKYSNGEPQRRRHPRHARNSHRRPNLVPKSRYFSAARGAARGAIKRIFEVSNHTAPTQSVEGAFPPVVSATERGPATAATGRRTPTYRLTSCHPSRDDVRHSSGQGGRPR